MAITEHSAAIVEVGEILAEKYRVERVLGEGGMGFVVAARHVELDELFAIKCMLPGLLLHSQALGRFNREARAAVRLKSQHVARVHDVGKLANGAPYMVMEYLEGEDVKAVLQRRGVLRPIDAVHYVLQALEGLAEAHASGIVHRDLKPANLFLTTRPNGLPCVKILDFGVSKIIPGAAGEQPMAITSTQSLLGSPAYMSPEQLRSAKEVDARSDIWSVGVILYELLIGVVPFCARTYPEQCVMVLQNEAVPLAERDPSISQGLSDVVSRCLRKSADDRVQSASELARRLAPFAAPEHQSLVESVARVEATMARRAAAGTGENVAADPSIGHDAAGADRRSEPVELSEQETTFAPSLPAMPAVADAALGAAVNAAPTTSTTAGLWGSTGAPLPASPRSKRRAAVIAALVGLALGAPLAVVAMRSARTAAPGGGPQPSQPAAQTVASSSAGALDPSSESSASAAAELTSAEVVASQTEPPARPKRPAQPAPHGVGSGQPTASASAAITPSKTAGPPTTAKPVASSKPKTPQPPPKVDPKKNPFGTRY